MCCIEIQCQNLIVPPLEIATPPRTATCSMALLSGTLA
jgi:hypothetical protein